MMHKLPYCERRRAISSFTLHQECLAIDRRSRNGKLSLRHRSRFTYRISTAVSNTSRVFSRSVPNVSGLLSSALKR